MDKSEKTTVDQKTLEYISNRKHPLLCDWQFDETLYHQLVTFLYDMRIHDVQTLLIIAPYQKVAYDFLVQSDKYKPMITEFKFING